MDDEAIFANCGQDLAVAVRHAMPGWVRDAVASRLAPPWTDEIARQVQTGGERAARSVGGRLDELLALDVDQQWTNPLSVVRSATAVPTEILAAAGVPEAPRDDHARFLDPDDIYDLSPASFAQLGPQVNERGIKWGAAKAHLHLKRRRAMSEAAGEGVGQ